MTAMGISGGSWDMIDKKKEYQVWMPMCNFLITNS